MIKRLRQLFAAPTKMPKGIPVYFEVEHEVHDKKQFQEEGHFVPALRELDAEGNFTRAPREWKGGNVHALTLKSPDGTQRLRALSDSHADAARMLGNQIRETLEALYRERELVSFNADQARKTKDERDRLVQLLLSRGMQKELSETLGIGEAAVVEFQRREAELKESGEVENLLRGAM